LRRDIDGIVVWRARIETARLKTVVSDGAFGHAGLYLRVGAEGIVVVVVLGGKERNGKDDQ
jgi:hypothetical protein